MPEPKVGTSRSGKPMHYSAGAIIRNAYKDILLIDRVKPPFGWAGPAGHVDVNEGSESAIRREVHEETGLEVVTSKLIHVEEVDGNTCSRGIECHHWHLYECTVRGDLIAKPDEVKSVRWVPWVELRSGLTLEPVWEYWFTKLGVLNANTRKGEELLRCGACSAPLNNGFCTSCGFAPSTQDTYIGIA